MSMHLVSPLALALLAIALFSPGCSKTQEAAPPEVAPVVETHPTDEAPPEPTPAPAPLEEEVAAPQLSEALKTFLSGFDEAALAVPNPLSGDAAAISTGRDEYQSLCAQCHGKNGNPKDAPAARALGVEPPDLSDPQDRVLVSDGARFQVMKNGIPSTAMQAFGAAMSDKQIWQILAYVETLSGPAPPASNQ